MEKKKYTKKEEIKGEEKNKYVCVWWEIDDEYFEGNGAQGLLKNRKSGCWRSYLVVLRSMVVNVIDRESGFNVVGGGARWFGVGGAVFGPVGDGRNVWCNRGFLLRRHHRRFVAVVWNFKNMVILVCVKKEMKRGGGVEEGNHMRGKGWEWFIKWGRHEKHTKELTNNNI